MKKHCDQCLALREIADLKMYPVKGYMGVSQMCFCKDKPCYQDHVKARAPYRRRAC